MFSRKPSSIQRTVRSKARVGLPVLRSVALALGVGSALIFDLGNILNFRKKIGHLFFAVLLVYYAYYLCKESAPYINDDFLLTLGAAFILNIGSVYITYLHRERSVLERVAI